MQTAVLLQQAQQTTATTKPTGDSVHEATWAEIGSPGTKMGQVGVMTRLGKQSTGITAAT